jgi:hypothetical protein
MSRVVAFLRSLGADGAARNARRLLDERRHERIAVDALDASRPSVSRASATPNITTAA